jgi:anti-sigma B factor antagonist
MDFTCTLTCVDDVATVTPRGEVDLPATAELRAILQDAASRPGIARIVVDLAGVTFLDSTALGVLVAGHTAAERNGRTLTLVNPGPMATMVLTVTALYDRLVEPPAGAAAVA